MPNGIYHRFNRLLTARPVSALRSSRSVLPNSPCVREPSPLPTRLHDRISPQYLRLVLGSILIGCLLRSCFKGLRLLTLPKSSLICIAVSSSSFQCRQRAASGGGRERQLHLRLETNPSRRFNESRLQPSGDHVTFGGTIRDICPLPSANSPHFGYSDYPFTSRHSRS